MPRKLTKLKTMNYRTLVKAIQAAHQEMKGHAVTAVNQALVVRNWLIGRFIIEFQQHGSDRATYGAGLLKRLSADLGKRKVQGSSPDMLERARKLYLCYPQFASGISATALRISENWKTGNTMAISATPSRKSVGRNPSPLPPERLALLSWSHFIELIRMDDPWKRAFYENECLTGNWAAREPQRQIESLLYERTGLSTNKKAVIERGRAQASKAPMETIDDLIRDPYVLEFSGLAERPEYSENDLETALLNHLQRFLLELGTGFCFEARQFRITLNNKHNRIDLVFYNRRLRCHLLIDLKVRAFRHTDAGQMNFYLNWFKANMADKGDNPPVGILLCSDKDHTEVEFATAGMDNRLFVSRYLTALPSAEQLKALVETDRAQLEMPRSKRRQ